MLSNIYIASSFKIQWRTEPPKDQPAPHRGGGVNSQVGECLVGRLTRNPEKLANAGGRCWKDTLGRKRSFGTHRPPYPTRRGLVTTWQETKKLLHDDGFERKDYQMQLYMDM